LSEIDDVAAEEAGARRVFQDVRARVVVALERVEVGQSSEAAHLLSDLELDLDSVLERYNQMSP
jgi:hypothetical protein